MSSQENENNRSKTILVTGGTGFLGSHIILQLLQKSYKVRTTLRSMKRKDEVIDMLKAGGLTHFENLSFVEADLLRDDNWDEAVQDCDYVLHVASPFPAQDPKDENELIIPARDGALRVLKAARDAGVKRVVLTSSFAAIGYSTDPKNHIFTETDWTDPNAPIPPYIKSKTIAEKAAWVFVQNEAETLELTVINPVGIFGPVLGKDYSASISYIDAILKGIIKETPPMAFGVVDVRDVADIHILAMEHPAAKGERFLATSDGTVSFYDVAELIRKERPELAGNIADLRPIDSSLYTQLSNHKAKTALSWIPGNKEEAILASVDSLQKV